MKLLVDAFDAFPENKAMEFVTEEGNLCPFSAYTTGLLAINPILTQNRELDSVTDVQEIFQKATGKILDLSTMTFIAFTSKLGYDDYRNFFADLNAKSETLRIKLDNFEKET